MDKGEKILVSACFLGAKVRYNGLAKPLHHQLLERWLEEKRVITVCPEVAGGMSVPREPAEQVHDRVITVSGSDVTQPFASGAQHALHLCRRHNIRFALLKEYSPSCGSQKVYDGSFSNTKINGQGVTASLLSENGIRVYSEETIEQLAAALADV
ncbi:DUF523 domain-containing protein [Thalassotalea euphylliae]|uniref:DUF523 domain-containing protein n=1 Tax=Thalassotalea euphylliae TaxID=1655234 RepID=UPI00362CFC38